MAPSDGDCSNAVTASGASQPVPVASHSGAAVGDAPGGTGSAMRRRQQRKRQEGRRVAWLSGLLVASRTHHTTGPSCPDCAMLAGRLSTLAQRLQKYEAIVDQAAAALAHLRPVQPVPTPVPAPMPAEPARHADAAHGTLGEEPTDMQVFAALASARLGDLGANEGQERLEEELGQDRQGQAREVFREDGERPDQGGLVEEQERHDRGQERQGQVREVFSEDDERHDQGGLDGIMNVKGTKDKSESLLSEAPYG